MNRSRRWVLTGLPTAMLFLVLSRTTASCEESAVASPSAELRAEHESAADESSLAIPILDGPDLKENSSWSETLRAIALTAIPDHFEDRKHWGRTREVFGGVRVERRGLNLRFSERKRRVNHGMWHKYNIELIDPGKTLHLAIDQIHPLEPNRFQFQIHLRSKLRCRGDFEQWLLGVKGLNLTLVSEADVDVIADCETVIRTKSNPRHLLPDLCLEPQVNRVHIFLKNLDVRRIGEIRGDLAEGIGDISRHDLENLLQAQEGRVAKKINEAIEKNRRRLQIPTSHLW